MVVLLSLAVLAASADSALLFQPHGPLRLVAVGYEWSGGSYVQVTLANETLGPGSLPECSWTAEALYFDASTVVGYVQATVEAEYVGGWVAVSRVSFVQVAPPEPVG